MRPSASEGPGQATDYVSVSMTYLESNWPVTAPNNVHPNNSAGATAPYLRGMFIGPAAKPVLSNGGYVFRSRVSIGSVTDGMTYTAMFGEKHLNPDKLGSGHSSGGNATAAGTAAGYDHPQAPGVSGTYWDRGVRILGLGLATRPDVPKMTTLARGDGTGVTDEIKANYHYGSWHPGIVQFAFGDTRVAQVKTHADQATLVSMGGRDDGTPYNLP